MLMLLKVIDIWVPVIGSDQSSIDLLKKTLNNSYRIENHRKQNGVLSVYVQIYLQMDCSIK